MNIRRLAVMLLVTVLATAALGWLSRAPWTSQAADQALLRLSWRLRGEKAETCRPRTQAELDALPVHMRTPEVCESRLLAYRLTVRIDDGAPDTATVLPGGARGDRPVFVLREFPLAPGEHRVSVRFTRDDGEAGDAGRTAAQDAVPRVPADSSPFAPTFAFDAAITAHAGEIHLITLAADGRRFVHIEPGTR